MPHEPSPSGMSFRLELFVDDLAASTDFYSRVLGFVIGKRQPDGYTLMTHEAVTLSLNRRANLPDDHPIQANHGERLGRGVELVLEVDDIEAIFKRVHTANGALSSGMQHQPWGLIDFRVIDPDGYYWRVTTRDK